MRTSLGFGVVSVAAVAVVLGACGSSKSSTGGGGDTGSTTSHTTGTGAGTTTSSGTAGAGTTTSGTTSTSTTSSTSSSTTTSSTSSTTSSSGSGCQGLGDPCTDCTDTSCNALYCTCAGDSNCTAVVSCVQACSPGDSNCSQGCFTSNPDGVSEAALLDDCAAQHCASKCVGTSQLTPCEKCLFSMCASAMNACFADSECAQFLQCVAACGSDSSCAQNCYDLFNSAEGDVVNCDMGPCSSSCG